MLFCCCYFIVIVVDVVIIFIRCVTINHATNDTTQTMPSLQRRIAKRGVELCEAGGLVVYSTCSFNPVENEAVVAYLLQAFPGGGVVWWCGVVWCGVVWCGVVV